MKGLPTCVPWVACAALGVLLGAQVASAAVVAKHSASRSAPGHAARPGFASVIGPAEVTSYIKQTVAWYREVQSLDARPRFARDAAARARLRAAALNAVRAAFQFARAAATALRSPAGSVSAMPASAAQRAAARRASRIAGLESQLDRIDEQLPRVSAPRRQTLQAERDAVVASLALERQIDATMSELKRYQSTALGPQVPGAAGLEGQIQTLERAVPEALTSPGEARAAPGTGVPRTSLGRTQAPVASLAPVARPAPTAVLQPQSAGILTLVGEWVGLESDGARLGDVTAATRALSKRLDAVQTPLRATARRLIGAPSSALEALTTPQLQARRRALQTATAELQQLSALIGPLAQQSLALADAQSTLGQWAESLAGSRSTVLRYLITHAAIILALIIIIIVISQLWRRALLRYQRDPRRRSHFQMLRRVTVGVVLAFVVLFGLVSEIGSLTTYVGFLTAGLAVALQNVILAVVAYFLLIGRYGVRIGDRITLAGVSGRVAEIGLIRIYLREVTGPESRPTGRLVVLSNAVLFQPQAMFKQIPGADYLWHTISLTLAASADVSAAERRLRATCEAVYEKYRSQIEHRYAAEKDLVDFETTKPWPEVRVRFTEPGLKFEVRYPVDAEQSVLVDREMLETLKALLAGEPALPVVPSGEPTLESGVG